jgi:hypothetical protein
MVAAALRPIEAPYMLLAGAAVALAESAYDDVRHKAMMALRTLYLAFPWLQAPLQVATLARLERAIERAASAPALTPVVGPATPATLVLPRPLVDELQAVLATLAESPSPAAALDAASAL